MKTDKMKMAVKEESEVFLVLTGDHTDSDTSIVNHLQSIYRALCFFNYSLGDVMQVVK
jgi:hypothetical protein